MWLAGAGALGLLGLVVLFTQGPKGDPEPQTYLTPASTLRDAHGLAVDVSDPSKLWIASHHGLYLLKGDKDLFQVGSGRDDYMGFSPHPTDPKTFFTSGHPIFGGNLGFQVSRDAGRTWEKVSNGGGALPADFHAMAVGGEEGSHVYGWYAGSLHASANQGRAWRVLKPDLGGANIITLAADRKEPRTVYAGSTDGAWVSRDAGETWQLLSPDLKGAAITALALGQEGKMAAYMADRGLMRSEDAGTSWQQENAYTGAVGMHLAWDPNTPGTLYLIDRNLDIHKSLDGGKSWNAIRKG